MAMTKVDLGLRAEEGFVGEVGLNEPRVGGQIRSLRQEPFLSGKRLFEVAFVRVAAGSAGGEQSELSSRLPFARTRQLQIAVKPAASGARDDRDRVNFVNGTRIELLLAQALAAVLEAAGARPRRLPSIALCHSIRERRRCARPGESIEPTHGGRGPGTQ